MPTRATLQAAVEAWFEARTEHAEALALREDLNAFRDAAGHRRQRSSVPPYTGRRLLSSWVRTWQEIAALLD